MQRRIQLTAKELNLCIRIEQKNREAPMRMENILSSWNGPDSLIVESFSKSVRFNMEMALDKACQSLPPALNNHDFRRMIAVKIAEQVRGGHFSVETINLAAAKAVEHLREQHSR